MTTPSHPRSRRRGPINRVTGQYVGVFDFDVGLADGLDHDQLERVRRAAFARVVQLDTSRDIGDLPGMGLLLDGCVLRKVAFLPGRSAAELLFAGEVLHPQLDLAGTTTVETTVQWTVVEPARVAVLDAKFLAAVQPWPSIAAALLRRALRRSHRLASLCALRQLPRTDIRILTLFWQLAEDIGQVRRDGVLVPLPITHAVLAALVGARRPTVTRALGDLADRGLLTREGANGWVVRGAPPQDARRLPAAVLHTGPVSEG
jgi:CRP/FNR family cyclic AMP-dependent transcriptional regulator